jgi:rod shape-determining protein MreC
MVKPAARLNSLDEVLVITDSEPRFPAEDQQDLATSETLKGQEAAAIKEQKKVSEIMAERLPALIDPNLPPDQQPLHDSSNPNPVAHPPLALHPDRFTPGSLTSGSLTSGSAANSATGADSGSTPDETAKPAQTGTKASSQGGQDGKSSPKPKQPEKPTQAAKPKPQENP